MVNSLEGRPAYTHWPARRNPSEEAVIRDDEVSWQRSPFAAEA